MSHKGFDDEEEIDININTNEIPNFSDSNDDSDILDEQLGYTINESKPSNHKNKNNRRGKIIYHKNENFNNKSYKDDYKYYVKDNYYKKSNDGFKYKTNVYKKGNEDTGYHKRNKKFNGYNKRGRYNNNKGELREIEVELSDPPKVEEVKKEDPKNNLNIDAEEYVPKFLRK